MKHAEYAHIVDGGVVCVGSWQEINMLIKIRAESRPKNAGKSLPVERKTYDEKKFRSIGWEFDILKSKVIMSPVLEALPERKPVHVDPKDYCKPFEGGRNAA